VQNFDAWILCEAIRATLENRKTDVVAYSELRHEVLASNEKQAQRAAFLKILVSAGRLPDPEI